MATIEEMIDRPPNFVVIDVQCLGTYLSIHGHQGVHTPWLDVLAYQGMLFDQFFVPGTPPAPVDDPFHNLLPYLLRQTGYTTHAIGPASLAPLADRGWYNEVHPEPADADAVSRAAIAFICRRAPEIDTPFYLYLTLDDLRRRTSDGHFRDDFEPELAAHLEVPPHLPDTPEVRHDLVEFYCALQSIDFHLARLMDEIEERGVEDDTLVVLTADGGPEFPGMRGTLYDAGLHTTLIFRWASILPGGFRSSTLLTRHDLAATLLDLAGAKAPVVMPGHSFKPLLDGETYAGAHRFFTDPPTDWDQPRSPGRAVRWGGYKYIRNYRPDTTRRVAGPIISRYGLPFIDVHFTEQLPGEELYDLQTDPWEQTNLAADPEAAPLLREGREQLREQLQRTGDPILLNANPES